MGAQGAIAQGAIAQGAIAQGAIAQGMAAQASTHRARRRAPSAESCERFHYQGRSDDKTARAHRGHSTGGQTCARRPRTSMARRARTAQARTRCAQATSLRSDTYDPLLQGFGGCPRTTPPPAAAQDAHPTQTDMPDPPDHASPRDALPAPRFPPRSAHPWLCAPAFPAAAPCGMGRGSTARQAVPALQWCVSRRPAARSAAASRGPSLEGPHRHARPPHHLRKDGCLQPRPSL